MAVPLTDGVRNVNRVPVERKRYNLAGDPYEDVDQVLSENVLASRAQGDVFFLINGEEWWFASGTADNQLVKKNVSTPGPDIIGGFTIDDHIIWDGLNFTLVSPYFKFFTNPGSGGEMYEFGPGGSYNSFFTSWVALAAYVADDQAGIRFPVDISPQHRGQNETLAVVDFYIYHQENIDGSEYLQWMIGLISSAWLSDSLNLGTGGCFFYIDSANDLHAVNGYGGDGVDTIVFNNLPSGPHKLSFATRAREAGVLEITMYLDENAVLTRTSLQPYAQMGGTPCVHITRFIGDQSVVAVDRITIKTAG